MTKDGVKSLYQWLSTAWPLVVKVGADDGWKQAKLRELYATYADCTDGEVCSAFQKWTFENNKFPTTHDILNEIKWARATAHAKENDNELYSLDVIYADGNEWSYGYFTRADFINHPKNKEHLSPEEWERRFNIRRRDILNRIQAQNKASARQVTMRETLLKSIEDKRGHGDE